MSKLIIKKPNNDGGTKIIPTPELRTFDFGTTEGKKQTPEMNAKIHDKMINHPDSPMADDGESFNEAANRVMGKVKSIRVHAPDNTAITTHNSAYGLIKYMEDQGLTDPKDLTPELRKGYTEQEKKNPTGSTFTLKGNSGDIHVFRHGQTVDNVAKKFRRSSTKLTEQGKQEAHDLGKKMNRTKIPEIYSSDLPRAIETSKIIASHQNMKKIKK